MSGVLVIAEERRGALRDVTFELIAAAHSLAEAGAGPVRVCVVAADPDAYVADLNADGVEEIITVTSPVGEFEAHVQADAVSAVLAEVAPRVLLAGHTVDSFGFVPAVAAQLGLGFASDVSALDWSEDALTVQRGIYGDRFVSTLDFPGRDGVCVLVRPGAFSAVRRAGGTARVRAAAVVLDPSAARTRHLGYEEPEMGDVDITKAEFLLAIGRGVGEEDEVERMLEIADKLGATLVSSRPLVDSGWLPPARQVGQSGQTVAPKIYLAMGISGAVQHLIGMRQADTIIAVNTDPKAPIFAVAAHGAVADMHDVSEALDELF